MRFPIDPLPPVGITEDPYEIHEKAGVTAVRSVTEPRVALRNMPPRRAPEPPRERDQRALELERRAMEDRRRIDRRIANQPVLVDTRSGVDRRRGKRRDDDPTTRVDLKA
jgi:hypothetical protein